VYRRCKLVNCSRSAEERYFEGLDLGSMSESYRGSGSTSYHRDRAAGHYDLWLRYGDIFERQAGAGDLRLGGAFCFIAATALRLGSTTAGWNPSMSTAFDTTRLRRPKPLTAMRPWRLI
jgi:hypothetical protein